MESHPELRVVMSRCPVQQTVVETLPCARSCANGPEHGGDWDLVTDPEELTI